jgi:ABC-type transport system substrate-binding protein
VDRALQKDAVAKGMQIVASKLPAIQHQWNFGSMYFATPDKLDPKVPFVKKEVRQAMSMAINRNAP